VISLEEWEESGKTSRFMVRLFGETQS
jgi:hypothetical protein